MSETLESTMEISEKIKNSIKKRILFTQHAVTEMLNEEDIIETGEIIEVIKNGTLLEDYPEDKRGHSCLLSGETNKKRTIHVVCAPKEEYLAIITVYEPDSKKWGDDFRKRRI